MPFFFFSFLDLSGDLSFFRLVPVIRSKYGNSGSGRGASPNRKVGALSESCVFGMDCWLGCSAKAALAAATNAAASCVAVAGAESLGNSCVAVAGAESG